MKKTQITASLLASLIVIVPSVIYAEDCCMPCYEPGKPLCNDEVCAGYSQYAGIELDCGFDFYAFGEFLYLRPFRSQAWIGVIIPPDVTNSPQIEIAHRFGYRPGFRVGIGVVAHDFDDWLFNADYTRYHQSFTKTFSATSPNTIFSTVISFNNAAFQPILNSSIKDKAFFNYDIVGVNIQRPNYLGQKVILSPFLGLKWLKRNVGIVQNQAISGSNLFNNARYSLSYSSIGIDAGFDGSWLLCWGFSLIGKVDVALLYAYKRNLSQIATPATISAFTPVIKRKGQPRHLDIFAKGGMGVGWGSYFCCNRYHVNLSATFEFLSDVVKLDFITPSVPNPSVALMGLTIRGQFDF